jgi:AcrR family transcriptional regulator
VTKWSQAQVEALLEEMVGGDDRKDKKRRRIIEAARAAFIEHGYKKTSVDDIARRAGVSKGTVYLYAKSKAELLMLALTLEKLSRRDLITAVFDPALSARDRLRRFIEIAFTGWMQIPLYAKVINGDADILMALSELTPDLGGGQEETRTGFIEQLIDETAKGALPKKELRDRAKALLALSFLAPRLVDERVRQGLSVERIAQLIADMIVDDIAAPVRRKP